MTSRSSPAPTNTDLRQAAREGRFRHDLLARIDLWTFSLPALRDRPEDIEPNVDFELDRFASSTGRRVRFRAEARRRFPAWATRAAWEGNFRDLGAAVTRMATLAPGGRVRVEDVDEEIRRLEAAWTRTVRETRLVDRLLGAAELDRFDRVQLEDVLAVCVASRSMAEPGWRLFALSRTRRKTVNDGDRVRKYLAKFGIDRGDVEALRG